MASLSFGVPARASSRAEQLGQMLIDWLVARLGSSNRQTLATK
jgi:hypothetical protein